eukprot:scaffold47065_cov60-Attheya_sp.AAC.4
MPVIEGSGQISSLYCWVVKKKQLQDQNTYEIWDHPAKGDRMNEIVILNPDMPGSWVWVIGSNEIVIQNQDVYGLGDRNMTESTRL